MTITCAVSDQNDAVAELCHRRDRLRVREPQPRCDLCASGPGAEVEHRHVGLWVLLVEQSDAPHMVLARHRARDRDRDGHGVAVLDQWRDVEGDAPGQDRALAGEGADGRLHLGRRAPGGPEQGDREQAASRRDHASPPHERRSGDGHWLMASGPIAGSTGTPRRPRPARPTARACPATPGRPAPARRCGSRTA